jgi:ATP-dependent Clp protease ATP-binding subunit ClpC
MNDVTLKELKTVVERAVRPVRATMARKRKIREELLGHLISVFEEAVEKHCDEQAALDQSRQRFGDPRELFGQLQGAIPRSDWFAGLGDGIMLHRRGESAFAHAIRVAAVMFASYAMTMVILPSVLWFRGRADEIGWLELMSLVAAICLGGLVLTITLLGHGIRQALFSRGTRSYSRGACCTLSSALVVPICGFVLLWTATGDVVAGYAHFRSLWWSIPVIPAIMFAAIWQTTKDGQDDGEWASLEIED